MPSPEDAPPDFPRLFAESLEQLQLLVLQEHQRLQAENGILREHSRQLNQPSAPPLPPSSTLPGPPTQRPLRTGMFRLASLTDEVKRKMEEPPAPMNTQVEENGRSAAVGSLEAPDLSNSAQKHNALMQRLQTNSAQSASQQHPQPQSNSDDVVRIGPGTMRASCHELPPIAYCSEDEQEAFLISGREMSPNSSPKAMKRSRTSPTEKQAFNMPPEEDEEEETVAGGLHRMSCHEPPPMMQRDSASDDHGIGMLSAPPHLPNSTGYEESECTPSKTESPRLDTGENEELPEGQCLAVLPGSPSSQRLSQLQRVSNVDDSQDLQTGSWMQSADPASVRPSCDSLHSEPHDSRTPSVPQIRISSFPQQALQLAHCKTLEEPKGAPGPPRESMLAIRQSGLISAGPGQRQSRMSQLPGGNNKINNAKLKMRMLGKMRALQACPTNPLNMAAAAAAAPHSRLHSHRISAPNGNVIDDIRQSHLPTMTAMGDNRLNTFFGGEDQDMGLMEQDRNMGMMPEAHGCRFDINAAWIISMRTDDDLNSEDGDAQITGSCVPRGSSGAFESEMDEQEGDKEQVGRWSRRLVIHPSASKRVCWDLCGFLLVVYDAVFIPLQLFNPPTNSFFETMAWLARFFWPLDMLMSFFTGYQTADGHTEIRLQKIATHYLRTWFPLDFTIVAIDWIDTISSNMEDGKAGSNNPKGMAKTMKAMRVIRTIRLLRLVRFMSHQSSSDLTGKIQMIFRSEETMIIAGIIKLIIIVTGLIHVIACCWFGVGQGDGNWVDVFELENASLAYQYVTSFHWGLTQFIGSADIIPQNHAERSIAVLVLMVAFVTSGVVVSSITTLMTRLQIVTAHSSKQLSILRRYLIQSHVSSGLAGRVQRNAKHVIAEQKKNISEDSVELLDFISKPLLVEIHFECHGHVLMWHPFFKKYHEKNSPAFRHLCHVGLSRLSLSKGDIAISNGEIPQQPRMFFIVVGSLQYMRPHKRPRTLESQGWACEAHLWVDSWSHRGELRATSDCEITCLNAVEFQQTGTQFFAKDFQPIKYAVVYVDLLNSVTDVSDLNCPEVDAHEIVNEVYPKPLIQHGIAKSLTKAVSRMSSPGYLQKAMSTKFSKRTMTSRNTLRSQLSKTSSLASQPLDGDAIGRHSQHARASEHAQVSSSGKAAHAKESMSSIEE